MSNALNIPQNEQFTGKTGSVKAEKIDKLSPAKRRWADNTLRALGLSSKNAQARMIGGAVSSAAVIEQRGNPQDTQQANTLRDTVLNAGTPPWKDARKAMKAGAAKVHLDLLSIPPTDRKLESVSQQGVNESFWVKRMQASSDPTAQGGVELAKAFICKPASKPGGLKPEQPSGGPVGGEVAREALASRAALHIASQTGIDVGMPETHVIELDGSYFPNGTPGQMRTCSVQEFRPGTGDLMEVNDITRGSMKQEQVASLAIYDTLTLNTDRHGGNIMRDAQGNLVPIDHGESFADNNDTGVKRLQRTMAGPHNALLSLPSAFQPMPKDMLKKLQALDPLKYKLKLEADAQEIGNQNPTMQGMISDGALENAYRAAIFTKMAAKRTPPLSPAQIQLAMASAATSLFGEKEVRDANGKRQRVKIEEAEFRANAAKAMDRFAEQGEVAKQVCTSENPEYTTLVKQVIALGWKETDIGTRTTAPDGGDLYDPLVLVQIIQRKLSPPREKDSTGKDTNKIDVRARRELVASLCAPNKSTVSPDQALRTVAAVRVQTLLDMMKLMGKDDAAKLRNDIGVARTRAGGDTSALLDELSLLMPGATTAALTAQKALFDTIVTTNQIPRLIADGLMPANSKTLDEYHNGVWAIERRDPVRLADAIPDLTDSAQKGYFIPDAVHRIEDSLKQAVTNNTIPTTDPNLSAARAAIAQADPFAAKKQYDALVARIDRKAFDAESFAAFEAEFDTIDRGYTFALDDPARTEFATALQQQDLKAMVQAMSKLRSRLAQLAPNAGEIDRLAKAIGVPDDDDDLQEAFAACTSRDADEVLARVAELRRRATEGEFGAKGKTGLDTIVDQRVTEIDAELTKLMQRYTVDPTNLIVLEIQSQLKLKNPDKADTLLGRLLHLAKQGQL